MNKLKLNLHNLKPNERFYWAKDGRVIFRPHKTSWDQYISDCECHSCKYYYSKVKAPGAHGMPGWPPAVLAGFTSGYYW